jgi:hypothetical protein
MSRRTILIVRAGALGDLLLQRPTIAGLRQAGWRVQLLAPPPGVVLVGPGPSEVDDHLPWDSPETAAILAGEAHGAFAHGSGGPVTRVLREADVVLAYTRSRDVADALRAVREPGSSSAARHPEPGSRPPGEGPTVPALLLHDPAPPADGPHAAQWLAEALAPLGVAPDFAPSPLVFTPAEHRLAEPLLAQLPRRFLAIHPGSGSPKKNWPVQNFRELVMRLCHPEGPSGRVGRPEGPAVARWLLVLGPADDPEPWREAPGAVLARSLPLRALGALLSRAGLFVGNDSGVAHLAAAAGTATVTAFGPTDPRLWSPVGPRVRCVRAACGWPDVNHVLSALPPDDRPSPPALSAG